MKNHPQSSSGVALILALAFILLLAAVVVAYFTTASGALHSAKVHKDAVSAQQLADMTMNVAMGQIGEGSRTTKAGASSADAKAALVWTSQPGLIRTYDTQGQPYRFFKLYSSDEMVIDRFPGGYWSPEENVAREVPAQWYEQPHLFTDLNEPVLSPFDWNRDKADLPPDAILVAGRPHFAHYPILDPAAQPRRPKPGDKAEEVKREGVEGFRIDSRRVSTAPENPPLPGYDPTGEQGGGSRNPAPMPVRWLYVLRDGRLTSPERAGKSEDGWDEVRWSPGSPGAPTRQNPIVGRVAFWADDETCKLNVNTASEGVFWDRRALDTAYIEGGKSRGGAIPLREEWQRQPGHPAMTCLSPVFSMLPDFRVPLGRTLLSADYAKFAAYYRLAPRLGDGGTRAGLTLPPLPPMRELDRDRLFASTDELLFAPRWKDGLRENSNEQITRGFLEKAKFFLTTTSRAPETNIFNRPRLALWPVQQERDPNAGHPDCPEHVRTPLDRQLARCAMLNGRAYHFQRHSVYLGGQTSNRGLHPTVPFAQQNPLVPPSSQRAELDWQVVRNRELYRYLQRLTAAPVPGVGGERSFLGKYGADRDPLITAMVDLLRTANPNTPTNTPSECRYDYAPPLEGRVQRMGEGQVVPLIPPDGTPGEGTKGYGRFPTITEAAMVFYREPDGLGAMLVLEPFSVSGGPPAWSPLVRYCVRGLEGMAINGTPLGMPPIATNLVSVRDQESYGQSSGMRAFHGLGSAFLAWAPLGSKKKKTPGLLSEEENYPFCSRVRVPVPLGAKGIQFSGGRLTVEIHAGYHGKVQSAQTAPPPETLVQTLHFAFPPATLPLPTSRLDFPQRASYAPVREGDVVRSVTVDPAGPSGGDLRLVAAPRVVAANYFRPHPDYAKTTVLRAHDLCSGGQIATSYLTASLLPNSTPGAPFQSRTILAGNGLNGALLRGTRWLGDWDSPVGERYLGAQISPPDLDNGDSPYGGSSEGSTTTSFRAESGPTFSPLRQLPSPVGFGSLPVATRWAAPQPWRTLLFCANPASGKHHPGWEQPRDHYLLDLFHQAIVEPYALSEPLVTAGKVNLNWQIVPFTYIQRDTALRGVLRATRLTTTSVQYEQPSSPVSWQLNIDADETLAAFHRRFAERGGCFKTASELCEMYLVPAGAKLADMKDGDPDKWWWKDYPLTGDNLREQPYGHLYSRVTARSNSFAVHYRVQVLAHDPVRDPATWVARPDAITREARGCAWIERYIDPDGATLPDFATDPTAILDDHYKFRVVRQQRFGP